MSKGSVRVASYGVSLVTALRNRTCSNWPSTYGEDGSGTERTSSSLASLRPGIHHSGSGSDFLTLAVCIISPQPRESNPLSRACPVLSFPRSHGPDRNTREILNFPQKISSLGQRWQLLRKDEALRREANFAVRRVSTCFGRSNGYSESHFFYLNAPFPPSCQSERPLRSQHGGKDLNSMWRKYNWNCICSTAVSHHEIHTRTAMAIKYGDQISVRWSCHGMPGLQCQRLPVLSMRHSGMGR